MSKERIPVTSAGFRVREFLPGGRRESFQALAHGVTAKIKDNSLSGIISTRRGEINVLNAGHAINIRKGNIAVEISVREDSNSDHPIYNINAGRDSGIWPFPPSRRRALQGIDKALTKQVLTENTEDNKK